MIQKIKINRFENNLLEYFRFIDSIENKIIINSMTENYLHNYEEIKNLFKNLFKGYNTIIFTEEKEKINYICDIKHKNIFTNEKNKIIKEMYNNNSFYLLKFKSQDELQSFIKYINDDKLKIYTKLKDV